MNQFWETKRQEYLDRTNGGGDSQLLKQACAAANMGRREADNAAEEIDCLRIEVERLRTTHGKLVSHIIELQDQRSDLMATVQQLINPWTACAHSLPDSDETVMTYGENAEEPVWPAYHDGERWQDPLGNEIDSSLITHWMPFPDPPAA